MTGMMIYINKLHKLPASRRFVRPVGSQFVIETHNYMGVPFATTSSMF